MNTQPILLELFPVQIQTGDPDAPFWEGTRNSEICIQFCPSCAKFQWGPDIICHHCHSFDLTFRPVAPRGRIHSWHRTWHPSHPEMKDHVPFIVLLVSLADCPDILMVGNFVGDQKASVEIGAEVEAVFEHHETYTLVQWRLAQDR
jgi:hypothetical protein